MSDFWPYLLGIVVVLAVASYLVYRGHRRRWIEFSTRRGFEYFDENGKSATGIVASERVVNDIKSFQSSMLPRGYHRHVAYRRKSKCVTMICEYVWYHETKDAGRPGESITRHTTCFAFRDPALDLPSFRIEHNFLSATAWSSRAEKTLPQLELNSSLPNGFRVFGNDEVVIRSVLSTNLVEAICRFDSVGVTGRGDCLIFDTDCRPRFQVLDEWLDGAENVVRKLAN